jgi:hypothetical protein
MLLTARQDRSNSNIKHMIQSYNKIRSNMAASWVTAPCSMSEVYRSFTGACCSNAVALKKRLWNVGKLPPDYTAQQPGRRPSSYSPQWEDKITKFEKFPHRNTHKFQMCTSLHILWVHILILSRDYLTKANYLITVDDVIEGVTTPASMRKRWVMASSSSHLTNSGICHVGFTDCRKLKITDVSSPKAHYLHTSKFHENPSVRFRVTVGPKLEFVRPLTDGSTTSSVERHDREI